MERRYIGLGLAVVALLCVTNAFAQTLAVVERDALSTVEANRPKLIARMVDQYRAPLEAHAITVDAFRAALWDLAPDRLLAASLADSIEEVHTIIAQAVAAPTRADAKDGPGTGANSWIGYTAGSNQASGTGSAVAAGTNNVAGGQNAFVGAGTFNAATAQGAFVGGGTSNVAAGISSLVIGGFDNQARVIDALVVAGAGNRATGARSVVVGGGYNLASGQWSFIGGGGRQTASSGAAGTSAQDNIAAGDFSTIGGGQANRAAETYSTVAGGGFNTASRFDSTVGGGGFNTASGEASTVAGGSNNIASGLFSAIPGGAGNVASGGGSVAMGTFALTQTSGAGGVLVAIHDGAFVFSDGSNGNFHSMGSKTFNVLATGGVRIVTGATNTLGEATPTWTCSLVNGSAGWACSSDRNLKQNLVRLNGKEILYKLASVPIFQWNPKGVNSHVTHFGPTAQDFHAAFGLGDSELMIGQQDADGVALAAIQGLKQELDEKNSEIEELKREFNAMKAKLGIQ